VSPVLALEVFASARAAGTLYRSDLEADVFLFGYSTQCPAESAVSLTMPIVRAPYDSMGTVHPIFEMNLPEGALLERLRALFAKTVPNLDSLGLLSIVGRSQIGRLRYGAPNNGPDEVEPQSLEELLTYTGAHDLFKDLLHRYARHSGVSGMQPKVLLRAAGNTPARLTHRGATHIVKTFDSSEYPELAANEFFCMQAARHAGIPTPAMELSRNRRLLVIERFDLRAGGSYLGCEDFCVLNGMRAHGRYDSSYELLAKRVGQFVSPERQRESLEQLFTMLALSCAIENGDAHLKNFAILYENATAQVRLAPAYDMLSTTPYAPRDVLALTLAGSKEFPDRPRLVAFGRQACGLPAGRVSELLDRVETGVRKASAQMRRHMKHRPDFRRAGEHFLATFERGLSRIKLKAR
jgi:serine/threonine-protein kinase HipA